MSTPTTIASPCINVCVIDPESRLCLGCYRTMDEIGGWSAMDDATRARIMEGLAARKHDAKPKRRGGRTRTADRASNASEVAATSARPATASRGQPAAASTPRPEPADD
ncbi:MAG: DUF1289 domain-containing protein [Pseudomonadota bacterium]